MCSIPPVPIRFLTTALRFMAERGFLFLFLLLCITAQPVFSMAAPTARVIYTADTQGYLHPCASCGGNSQGGIARRVALMPALTSGHMHPLAIAGPNEFYADRPDAAPLHIPERMQIAHTLYSRMEYTAIAVSPASRDAFRKAGLSLLPNGIVLEKKPVTEYYRAGGLTVACVFFPPADGGGGDPTAAQFDEVVLAGRDAAEKADLVIGISSWGLHTENASMHVFAGTFQIILGGGTGIAIPGQAMNMGTTPGPLWIRSDRMGRAINVLDIHRVPPRGSSWLDGVHFTSRLIFLEKDLPEDGEAVEITAAVPRD